MAEIPAVWFWISGIAFALQSVFLVGLMIALARALRVLAKLQEQIEPLAARLDKIGENVESVTRRVDGIAEKVDGLVASAQSTVKSLGTGATGIVRAMDSRVSAFASGSKVLGPLLFVLKLIQTARQVMEALGLDKRRGKSHTHISRRGVEQPGSSSGS